MVLFLFVLMLLNLNEDTEPMKSNLLKIAGVIGGMCLVITLVGSLKTLHNSEPVILQNPNLGLVKNLGKVLFRDFLLPFEVSSLLLLSAMVGSILLAKKDHKNI